MKTNMSLLAALLLLSSCAPVSRVRGGRVSDVIDQKMDRWGYIEAIGIGASDPALPTETQRKALSRDAAIVKAQYELLTLVKGVELEGGLKISRALEQDSAIETRLKQTIRGASIVKSEFTADNGCVVTLRLDKGVLEETVRGRP